MRKVLLIIIAILLITPGCFYISPGEISPPEITSFSLSPETIVSGQSVTISWQILNASSARIEPALADIESEGTIVLKPETACTYTLFAENDYGTAQKTIRINLIQEQVPDQNYDIPYPPVIHSFTAEPDEIWAGAPIRLTWEVSDATSLSIRWGTDEISLKPDSGSIIFHPVIATSYILIADNPGGSTFANARVTVSSSIGGGGLGNAEGAGCT
jgi:hypothetical protein